MEKKSYIEEGEFDENGVLIVGRKIFDNGTCKYIGDCLIGKRKKEYLKEATTEEWKEILEKTDSSMPVNDVIETTN